MPKPGHLAPRAPADPSVASVEGAQDDLARGDAWHERASRLEAVIEPVLAALGFELAHLEWSGSGRHRLQVFIDHPDGVDLDDCARLSPVVSNALDAAEAADPAGPLARLLTGSYNLELSSPGLDRPLSRRRHFERFQGKRVRIRTFAPLAVAANGNGDGQGAQKNFHGRIAEVEPDPARAEDDRNGTVVVIDEDSGVQHRIPLAQIRRANLIYEGDG